MVRFCPNILFVLAATNVEKSFDPFESITNFLQSPWLRVSLRLFVIFIFILWLSSIIWTYRDAKLRDTAAIAWSSIVFFFNFFGLILYLILRPPEFSGDAKERELEIESMEYQIKRSAPRCPACLRFIEDDFLVCPYCYKKLKTTCMKCGKLLKIGWTLCPYCRVSQKES